MATIASSLIGCWLLASSGAGGASEERVEVEFKPTGELIYATLEKEKWSIILLNYRLEDAEIVSNQPSAPREERTIFSLRGNDELVLRFGGQPSSYTRINACTFPGRHKTSLRIWGRVKQWYS